MSILYGWYSVMLGVRFASPVSLVMRQRFLTDCQLQIDFPSKWLWVRTQYLLQSYLYTSDHARHSCLSFSRIYCCKESNLSATRFKCSVQLTNLWQFTKLHDHYIHLYKSHDETIVWSFSSSFWRSYLTNGGRLDCLATWNDCSSQARQHVTDS